MSQEDDSAKDKNQPSLLDVMLDRVAREIVRVLKRQQETNTSPPAENDGGQ